MTNSEIYKAAASAASPEELLKIARENGIAEFSEEKAEECFKALHRSGEISDSELDQAVGGCSGSHDSSGQLIVTLGNLCRMRNSGSPQWICKNCKQPAALCHCLSDASGFEEGLGFAFCRNVKNTCETCTYLRSYNSLGNYYCSNPKMKK